MVWKIGAKRRHPSNYLNSQELVLFLLVCLNLDSAQDSDTVQDSDAAQDSDP